MPQLPYTRLLALVLAPSLLVSCAHSSTSQTPEGGFKDVSRADFNRLAAELAIPIFWVEDKNGNGAVDQDEVSGYWGLGDQPKLADAYARILKEAKSPSTVPTPDAKRRALVREELSQGRQTIVQTDLSKASDEDKAIVRNILDAAEGVERIFAQQTGVAALKPQIARDDTLSQFLFFRNQGPWCRAPKTENNPDCNALASKPKPISGSYPAQIQTSDPKFCSTLAARKDADNLLSPFVTVRDDGQGRLIAVPYSEAFKKDMTAVSQSLKKAADAIKSPEEAAFKTYLLAAAQSFLDNNWQPADEAWSRMNAENSKWYLRIGPDETYDDPCSRKANFHVSFARINKESLAWQKKLDPLKNDMEKAMAEVGGKPYKAREVSFHLPDFIEVMLNAGDSRPPHGATIGQSLPNWGPVANEGRGRTVAMVNFYQDADSKSGQKTQAESVFCADTMGRWVENEDARLLDTLLHEASHNLGPSHEYQVKGKTDDQIFGGPLASMLEELKAQTGSLFFGEYLLNKKVLDQALVEQSHLTFTTWAFGHISNGMRDAQGKSKPYSQLAAIQLGFLMKERAAVWSPDKMAANGKDQGCMTIDTARFHAAVPKLAKTVVGLKARGDKKLAEQLVKDYVDSKAATHLHAIIAERWLRAPTASFVYSIKLD
jgi:hypothetical protein